VEKFKSFITEEKEDKYKVVILTVEHGDKSITAKKFEKEASKLGFEVFSSNFKGVILQYDDKNGYQLSNDKDTVIVNRADTVVFVRGTPNRDSYLDLVSELERIGVTCINSRTTINICADKYRSWNQLKDFRLNQPKTVIIPSEEHVDSALEALDTKFPIILKTLRGSKGVGVLFIESERSLHSIVQLLFKQDEDSDILIQEYIKNDFDVRVLVLGETILGTMRRDVVEGDFRSNVAQGAKVKKYKLSDEEKNQCLVASKAVGGNFTAVDFIPNNDKPYFLEVNSSPGTDGIEDANPELNVAREVLEYYKNKKLRYAVPTAVGFYEKVKIKPFGDMTAKFDTGNGILSVLHADNIDISGKKITFKLMGKTVTTKLVKTYEAQTGAGVDERPVVELELEFRGHLYTLMFGLDDRTEMGTPLLLNRYSMKAMNVMVDPQRKFLVTKDLDN